MTKQMNEVLTHTFNDTHKVRSVTLEGEPWFVAADVCRTLEINVREDGSVATSVALRKLDKAECKAYRLRVGGQPNKVISESGLYTLIMRSDKPQAKPFQDWVTKEVLPSIRKTGGYQLDPGQTIPLPTSFAESMRQHAETLMKLAASDEALVHSRVRSF